MSDAYLELSEGALLASEFSQHKQRLVNRVLSDVYLVALSKIGTIVPLPPVSSPLNALFWAGKAVRMAGCSVLPEHYIHHVTEWHYGQWCGSVEACGGWAPIETAKTIELSELGNRGHWKPFNKLVDELKDVLEDALNEV